MNEFDFGSLKKKEKKDEPEITTVKGDASPTIQRKKREYKRRQKKPTPSQTPTIPAEVIQTPDIKKIIEDTANLLLEKIQSRSISKNEELRIKYSTWTWKELYKLVRNIHKISKINGKYATNCTATELLDEIIKVESSQ